MAKRELIDRTALREEIYTTTEWNGDVHRIVYERSLDDAKEITEEEIVKPYLNKIAVKLGELIAENMENDNGLPIPNQYAYCYQEVLEFVNNLLTGKEQRDEV